MPVPSDPRFVTLFRRVAGFVPTGVAILSTEQVAMTVSSLHCVSVDPPMISVALTRGSAKGAAIINSGRFHARLLRQGEEALSRGEGIPSGPAMAEMECMIEAVYPAGDHDLVLAAIRETSASAGYPIVYWRRGFHAFQPHYSFLVSRDALIEFVAAWETGTLPKAQWTHAAHVAVCACYSVRFSDTAFNPIRDGIIRYNLAVGTVTSNNSGYHETLTRWWSMLIAKVTEEFSDPWTAACNAVALFGEERDLHCLYYSFDVVRDPKTRQCWVPPDLDGPY